MLITDNLTGITIEVHDEQPVEMEPPVMVPTAEERIEALEMALLEVILNG